MRSTLGVFSLRFQSFNSRALEILEHHLDNIESSRGKREQCSAYGILSILYRGKNDFAKSNVYFEHQLQFAKETKNVELEASALNIVGHNYGRMGDYGNAMACFEQALVIDSERGGDRGGGDRIGRAYSCMGDMLEAQEGREKEAIVMFQKSVGYFDEGNTSEKRIRVFLKLGQAYTTIGAWDEAIASLEKCLSITESIEDERLGNQLKALAKLSLGKTYLEKFYCTNESLVGIPERNDELIRQALYWSEAGFKCLDPENQIEIDPTCFLDLAQEYYFLGDSEKAHNMLK